LRPHEKTLQENKISLFSTVKSIQYKILEI